MSEIMDGFEHCGYLVELDEVIRAGHTKYRRTPPEFLIDHTPRSAASDTHDYIVAGMGKRFWGRKGVRPFEIRGLHLWLFENVNAVIRIKKMDGLGRTQGIQTGQAKDYDADREIPGLPPKPIRLVAGYWENETALEVTRTQIARPFGRRIDWCAAIVPMEKRKDGARVWAEVARQYRIA